MSRHVIASLHCAALLSGCMVVTPSPTIEAVHLIGSVVTSAASLTPATAQNTVVFAHDPIKRICIEYNPAVALVDFVPAMQNEFQERGVESRLYDTGMQPSDCPAVLQYSAFLEWDRRALDDRYSSYLTFAALTLRSYDGKVLASANYQTGQMGLDKWSPTRSKVSAVITALLAGN